MQVGLLWFRDIVLEWLRSDLSHRQQAVKIGQCFSDFQSVSCGLSLGNILGPLLSYCM